MILIAIGKYSLGTVWVSFMTCQLILEYSSVITDGWQLARDLLAWWLPKLRQCVIVSWHGHWAIQYYQFQYNNLKQERHSFHVVIVVLSQKKLTSLCPRVTQINQFLCPCGAKVSPVPLPKRNENVIKDGWACLCIIYCSPWRLFLCTLRYQTIPCWEHQSLAHPGSFNITDVSQDLA